MSTILEASVPAEEFALDHALDRFPDSRFEIVRLVGHGGDNVFPLLWGHSESVDGLGQALDADPSTTDVEVVARFGDEVLFRVRLLPKNDLVPHVLVEENGTVLDGHGEDGTWYFRFLFPDHGSVSAVDDFCDDHDIEYRLQRIYQVSESEPETPYGLTREQCLTIRIAFEAGYYDVPREQTLEELAAELGVSHQALSERLRRGHRSLIDRILKPTGDGTRGDL